MGKTIKVPDDKSIIKYIEILHNDSVIEIPIFPSLGALMAYQQGYEESGNYKTAFCRLILEMIKTHSRTEFKETLNITDIESIEDTKLLFIMQNIINNKSEYIEEYFRNNHCELSYENYYKAYEYQTHKFAENISQALKPMFETMSVLSKSVGNMMKSAMKFDIPKPLFDFTKLYETINTSQTTENIKDLIPLNNGKEIQETNTPQQVVEKLIEQGNEYHRMQLIVFSEVKDILKGEQEAREKSDIDSRKREKINLWLAIIAIIIAVLSLIGLGNICKLIDAII